MSVKIVDLSPHIAECYSNEIHYKALQDDFHAAEQRTNQRFAAELVTQYYLDSCAANVKLETMTPAQQKKAGAKLLQLVKQRITQQMHAA